MYSFIARQAIFNNALETIAYELLFRDGNQNCFPKIDYDKATSKILANNELTTGIEKITAGLPGFINVTEQILLHNFPTFLNPKQVVIEILETTVISKTLIQRCKALKQRGYKLAIDDYDLSPEWELLFPYVDIIKVDVLGVEIAALRKFIERLETLEIEVELLAEKVETRQQFEQLKAIGFTCFQGYFFARPEMLKQPDISATQQNILLLLAQSSEPELDFDKLSQTFSQDLALSYKLLRFINSPAYCSGKEISSLRHALIYLGEAELKKFIALLAIANLAENKPTEIVKLSLARAKFCELISIFRADPDNPPKGFLTGMLSLIDGILDQPMKDILAQLPVHPDIHAALLQQQNYLAEYLALAIAMEQGEWPQAESIAEDLNLPNEVIYDSLQQAVVWSEQLLDC